MQIFKSGRREASRSTDPTIGAEPHRITRLSFLYLAPADIQVARVERQMAVYFCSALAECGASVELVALGIRLAEEEKHRPAEPLALYRPTTRFPVDVVPTRLHQNSGAYAVGLTRLRVHTMAVARRIRKQPRDHAFAVYVKNFLPGLALLALRTLRPFVLLFEVHTTPRTALQKFVLRHADGVVANSRALARDLVASGAAIRVLPTHQGVDLGRYLNADSKPALRERLGMPVQRPIAVYTGKLHPGYEEVDYIVTAAAMPACADVMFVLVGGREDHVSAWRREVERRGIRNVTFTGFIPPGDVHEYQLAGDALLLYYPSKMELNTYRSPGKLFGYMATGVPIVAVDLPVLREVLGDPPAAILVPPDSPAELATAVRHVIDNRQLSSSTAAAALERVKEFTWTRRAELVLAFIEQLSAALHDPRVRAERRPRSQRGRT